MPLSSAAVRRRSQLHLSSRPSCCSPPLPLPLTSVRRRCRSRRAAIFCRRQLLPSAIAAVKAPSQHRLLPPQIAAIRHRRQVLLSAGHD
jgi:hypothetical protein